MSQASIFALPSVLILQLCATVVDDRIEPI
jgi:hypothetical protein